MLSDEDRREILMQEAARASAEAQARQQAAQVQAREVYRAQVRAAYQARPLRRRWWLLFAAAWLIAAVLFLDLRPAAVPDDTSGGIASTALIVRCEQEVLSQLGQLAAEFPDEQESERQITASSDGKRWDGWVVSRPEVRGRAEFSCVYSPPMGSVQVQLIR